MKIAVKEAFGSNSIPEDSPLYQAVCGFIAGSQDGEEENRWFVADYIKRLHKTENVEKVIRASKAGRKALLSQMVTYMFDGAVVKE